MRKTLAIILVSVLLVLGIVPALTGCGEQKDSSVSNGSNLVITAEEFGDRHLGVLAGSIQEKIAEKAFPDARVSYFNTPSDLVVALKAGNIDGFTYEQGYAEQMTEETPGVDFEKEPVGTMPVGIAFQKNEKGEALAAEFNEFFAKLKEDGTFDEIEKNWTGNDAPCKPVDTKCIAGNSPVLNLGTTGDSVPYSFYANGKLGGIEVDVLARFCREYGYGLHMETVNWEGMISGLKSGMYDMLASCMVQTDERRENVCFSDPEKYLNIVFITRTTGGIGEKSQGFWASVKDSFVKTFIREDRWKMILDGIGVTIYISVFSAVFGTIAGFGVCALRRSKSRAVFNITGAFIRVLQGTPLVVLLMIFYYIVFANTGMTGIWVSIFAFSINFAVYTGEMMRKGIDAVDPGQMEAALALGYTKAKAFLKIVFPQAVRNFLPVYKGEFISLVKMTAVVGYIAVEDLTKVSDLIRSRTYEAFFPLIATAIIYFIIAQILLLSLQYIEKKTEPDRVNRKVKGVKTE